MAADKIADLLEIKRRLGFPDCRLDEYTAPAEFRLPASDAGGVKAGNTVNEKSRVSPQRIENLVAKITAQVMELLSEKE
jgi:hypothetical protein